MSIRIAVVAAFALGAPSVGAQCFVQSLSPDVSASPVFGFSTAVDGDHALVASLVGAGGPRLVAYERLGGEWVETQTVAGPGDGTWQFGFSLAMEDDLAVVGMPRAQPNDSGGVAIYRRGPGGWALEDTLFGPFAGEDDTQMGYDVAIDGATVYASSLRAEIFSGVFTPARVRVVEEVAGTWQVTNVLFDVTVADTGFGVDIAADAGRLFVGISRFGSALPLVEGTGGVRVFDDPSGSSGAFELVVPDGIGPDDRFGFALDVSDGVLFATALAADRPVYVFEHDRGAWNESARLTSPAGGSFGFEIAAADARAYVTTFAFEAPQAAGVSVLTDDGDGWGIASFRDASGTAKYGASAATDGATLLVGVGDADPSLEVLDLATVGDVLVACDPQVSVAAPAPTTLEVRAGAARAGWGHFVLGSLSGTSPGFTAQGLAIPLNPDVYFSFTFTSPNTPLLSNSFGVLDVHGQADVVLALPPGLPAAAIGLELQHAAVLLDGGPQAVSAPVAVELVP